MKRPSATTLRRLAYGLVGLLAFLAGLYSTFPDEAVATWISHEVSRRSKGRVELRIEGLSPYWLTGLEADRVVVGLQGSSPPLEIPLVDAHVRLRLLPLFLLRPTFSIGVENSGGHLDAVAGLERDAVGLSARVEGWRLEKATWMPSLAALGVRGVLSLGMAGRLHPRDVPKSVLDASITLREAVLGPGSIAGFTLPKIALGQIDAVLAVEKGALRVTTFRQQGGDVQLRAAGQVSLRPQLGRSALDLCLKFRPGETLLARNPTLKTALQLAEVRLRKDPEGFLHLPLAGTIARPRVRTGLCR